MESIPARFKWLLRELGTNQAGLARRSRLNEKTVSQWMQGITKPRESNIEAIAEAFNLPAGPLVKFVLHGDAPPKVHTEGDTHNGSGATVLSPEQRRTKRLMPDVDTLAKAGASWQTGRHSLQVEDFNADRFIHNPTDHEDAVCFTVEGDSMSPTILDGQKLVASPSAQVTDGCICLCYLTFDGTSIVRRVEMPDDETYRLVPLKRGLQPQTYRRDEVRPWRVLGRWEPW